jgi:tRNA(Ile2) C34 agmatinyltransferase TiaS
MILRPICPKCGGAMKAVDRKSKEGTVRKTFRCKRNSCHYTTANKSKVRS